MAERLTDLSKRLPDPTGTLLSVIIVTYQSAAHIGRCIDCVAEAASALDFELILVDNASSDGTVDVVRQGFGDCPWLKIVANSANLGFARACNQAAKLARGDYILLLNPDVFVQQDALLNSLGALPNLGRCGAVMARTFWDDQMRFQQSFLKDIPPSLAMVQHTTVRRFLGRWAFMRLWEMDWRVWSATKPEEVMAAPGGYFLIPRQLFLALGGFDERFFMYYEDADLCKRLKSAGWKIYLVPDAKVVHYCGQSLATFDRGRMNTIQKQSLIAFYRKHYPVWALALCASMWLDGLAVSAIKGAATRFAKPGARDRATYADPGGIELKWEEIPQANYYFLEITSDPCFIHRVGAVVTESRFWLSHRSYRLLAPDTYFWRAVPMHGRSVVGRIHVGRFTKKLSEAE